MYIISIMAAILGLLSWANISAHQTTDIDKQQNTAARIVLESKELLAFAQATLDLTIGTSAGSSGKALSFATLQQDHLLPNSFPTQTPFGQNWQAIYVLDHTTGKADLLIWAAGSLHDAGDVSSQYIAAKVIEKLSSLDGNLQASNGFLVGNSISVALGTTFNNSVVLSAGAETLDLNQRCGHAIEDFEPVIFVTFPNP